MEISLVNGDHHPRAVCIAIGRSHHTIRLGVSVCNKFSSICHRHRVPPCARTDETTIISQCPHQLRVNGLACLPPVITEHTDQAIFVVASQSAPPRPTLSIAKDKVMMDDTSHIKCRHHRKVVMATSANFLIIAHDAELTLPVSETVTRQRITELLTDLTHILHRRIGPIAVSQNAVRHARTIT